MISQKQNQPATHSFLTRMLDFCWYWKNISWIIKELSKNGDELYLRCIHDISQKVFQGSNVKMKDVLCEKYRVYLYSYSQRSSRRYTCTAIHSRVHLKRSSVQIAAMLQPRGRFCFGPHDPQRQIGRFSQMKGAYVKDDGA